MDSPVVQMVHPTAVVDVVKLYGKLLTKGLAAAGETDIRGCIVDFVVGRRQLWMIYEPGQSGPLALFRTEIMIDDKDGPWICLSALAGHDVRRWARELSRVMGLVATMTGCKVVRFAGKEGWGRLIPECRIVGHVGDETLFERDAAA